MTVTIRSKLPTEANAKRKRRAEKIVLSFINTREITYPLYKNAFVTFKINLVTLFKFGGESVLLLLCNR